MGASVEGMEEWVRWFGQWSFHSIPDTPANRRHLHTLAMDWCAHGVRWCDATTASGLPKRGAMSLWEAHDRAITGMFLAPLSVPLSEVPEVRAEKQWHLERRAVEVTDE